MAQFSLGISEGARPLHVGACQVYVGTCSWADPNFVKEGQFYPRGVGADQAVGAGQLPEEVIIACWDYFAAFVEEFIKAGKLGHVLFQFPKGQGYTSELFEHLERWEPYLRRWPVAVEIRHRSWLQEPA